MHACGTCLPVGASPATLESAAEGAGVIPPSCCVEQAMCTLCSTARGHAKCHAKPKGGRGVVVAGVTVLDAVERWCLHVMRMVQSCSDSDRDTISDLSEMSEEVQAPCHDLQAEALVRSEGSS